MIIMSNSDGDIVVRSNFFVIKSLCITIKCPNVMVSVPLNRQIFLLWDLYYFNFNIEWVLWNIPDPNILYISLWY